MTTELQRAMAHYEEARIHYKKAVLASLNGASNGDAIREAIQKFQKASAELKSLRAEPVEPENAARNEPAAFLGWQFVRRLLAG
jgi:hypothetical protein